MKEISRSITFDVERRKKDGVLVVENVPIRCIVTFNCQRIVFFTGHRIDISKFNREKGSVKNGCTNKKGELASKLNASLDAMRSNIQEAFKVFEVKGVMPTPDELKKAYKLIHTGSDTNSLCQLSFFHLYDEFISVVGKHNNWSKTIYKTHVFLKKCLFEFNNNITFEDITESCLQNFLDLLIERGLKNTTISRYMRYIKHFLNWATKKGYNANISYKSYNPRLKNAHFELKKVIYLTKEELFKLYNLNINEKYIQQARDIFCFCCFTGLRYSDVKNLRKHNIVKDKIEIVTKKDIDSIRIELNRYSKCILDKYLANSCDDLVFPVPPIQNYNERLKIIGKMSNLNDNIVEIWYQGNVRHEAVYKKWEKLSSHVARKTFIVFALSLGIPPAIVMRWTGHSDFDAMKPYIDIIDTMKANEMSKFDDI